MDSKKKYILVAVLALLATPFIWLYKNYNPSTAGFYPSCPSKILTGLECPGCGSQRAIHHLLNLELSEAFYMNPMLVISIPYILLGYWFEWKRPTNTSWLKVRKFLYGPKAILFIFTAIIAFWIARNIWQIP